MDAQMPTFFAPTNDAMNFKLPGGVPNTTPTTPRWYCHYSTPDSECWEDFGDQQGLVIHMINHSMNDPQYGMEGPRYSCPWSTCPGSKYNSPNGVSLEKMAHHFLGVHAGLSLEQRTAWLNEYFFLDQVIPTVDPNELQVHPDVQLVDANPDTVEQNAIQRQVKDGPQQGSLAPTYNPHLDFPAHGSGENTIQTPFDGGVQHQHFRPAVDATVTLTPTANPLDFDYNFGEQTAPALPATTYTAPQQAVYPDPTFGNGYGPATPGSLVGPSSFASPLPTPPRPAPKPARQPAANRVTKPSAAKRVPKTPTVLCSSGCGKLFVTAQVMRDHVAGQHMGIKISCDHPGCNEVFPDAANMRRHKKSVHEKVTFKCPNVGCPKTHSRRDNMKRHRERCTYPAAAGSNNQ